MIEFSAPAQVAVLVDAPNLEPLEPIFDALEGLPIDMWIAQSAFIALGPSVAHHLRLAGFSSWLDLRLGGEAETVARSVEAVARIGVRGVTVDLASGADAAIAARKAARGRLKVIGVPNPLDRPEMAGVRAEIASKARLDGIYIGAEQPASPRGQTIRRSDRAVAADLLIVAEAVLTAADPHAAATAIIDAQRAITGATP